MLSTLNYTADYSQTRTNSQNESQIPKTVEDQAETCKLIGFSAKTKQSKLAQTSLQPSRHLMAQVFDNLKDMLSQAGFETHQSFLESMIGIFV